MNCCCVVFCVSVVGEPNVARLVRYTHHHHTYRTNIFLFDLDDDELRLIDSLFIVRALVAGNWYLGGWPAVRNLQLFAVAKYSCSCDLAVGALVGWGSLWRQT